MFPRNTARATSWKYFLLFPTKCQVAKHARILKGHARTAAVKFWDHPGLGRFRPAPLLVHRPQISCHPPVLCHWVGSVVSPWSLTGAYSFSWKVDWGSPVFPRPAVFTDVHIIYQISIFSLYTRGPEWNISRYMSYYPLLLRVLFLRGLERLPGITTMPYSIC